MYSNTVVGLLEFSLLSHAIYLYVWSAEPSLVSYNARFFDQPVQMFQNMEMGDAASTMSLAGNAAKLQGEDPEFVDMSKVKELFSQQQRFKAIMKATSVVKSKDICLYAWMKICENVSHSVFIFVRSYGAHQIKDSSGTVKYVLEDLKASMLEGGFALDFKKCCDECSGWQSLLENLRKGDFNGINFIACFFRSRDG